MSIEFIIIPHYHVGKKVGYLTLQAPGYYAWWFESAPQLLRVGSPGGEAGREWLELNFDAQLADENGADLIGAPLATWSLEPSFNTRTCHRADSVELRWRRQHEQGEAVCHLKFAPQSVAYTVEFIPQAQTPYRIGRCALGKGTLATRELVFDAQPQSSGIFHHAPDQLLDHRNLWLTPAPFAYAFLQPDKTWSIAAVEAPLSELSFNNFSARPLGNDRIEFIFAFNSRPPHRGAFRAPALVWRFGFEDEFSGIRAHAQGLVENGVLAPVDRTVPDWWRGVMVCGWHRQCELAALTPEAKASEAEEAILGETGQGSSSDYANQKVYEHHVAAYEKAGLSFDILTIDLGWSKSLGDWTADPEKWPDLPGFIRSQHEKGRRVLLWICGMKDGLTEEEKVGDLPTNPFWLKRMDKSLHSMLSSESGCLNADGLKFDFTSPKGGPNQTPTENELHGYLYLYELYRVISETARRYKPDALLDYQSAHPQFAHLHGMTRLNDFFLPQRQALRVMRTRAEIARAATFGGLIDTDCPAGLEYLRHSHEFGNISLYLTQKQLNDPAVVEAIQSAQAKAKP